MELLMFARKDNGEALHVNPLHVGMVTASSDGTAVLWIAGQAIKVRESVTGALASVQEALRKHSPR